MNPDHQVLKLSRIYRSCLNEIEAILGVTLTTGDEQRIVQVISDAVEAAVKVTEKDDVQG
jgi:hypothetical protein